MTNRKSHMRFRLMTLTCYKLEFYSFGISRDFADLGANNH